VKKTQDNPGGMVSVESPIAYSNVSLVDPVTKSPVKTSWRFLETGEKVRISRGKLASESIIPRPEILKQRKKPRPAVLGSEDTPLEKANEVTHVPGNLPTALKMFMEESGHGSSDDPTRFVYSRRGLFMSPPSSKLSEDQQSLENDG